MASMQFSNVSISDKAAGFLCNLLLGGEGYIAVNQLLISISGISDFFACQGEMDELFDYLSKEKALSVNPNRSEYGDFQTNFQLAQRVTNRLKEESQSPEVLVEPTFGKGRFILAALHDFPLLQRVIGFEIYKPYVWETKFVILDFFLENRGRAKPEIILFHQDVFTVDFQKLGKELLNAEVLILGNPPWVTNSELGSLNSANLPKKSNFKNLSGLDAMTGKGNFDIGESVTLMLLRAFQNHSGQMAFLVKNAVIKNLVFDQKKSALRIGRLEQVGIDAKKEFGASVEASLFKCQLNQEPEYQCLLTSLEPGSKIEIHFGWNLGHFVSNIEKYQAVHAFDGVCPFEWRQGLKHDCSSVMEFERVNGHFSTSQGQVVHLENDLVYGILKSSEIKGGVLSSAKRFTIVTQRKVGQDTGYIEKFFPETFAYLDAHRVQFADRKSSIYRGKPPFSIFGIGDYSFLPYKVAVSGLYKSPAFTLVLPENGKPLMLDDTCYFIGFEKKGDACIAYALLNHSIVKNLLDAISFLDAKRVFTKEILIRIDLAAIVETIEFKEVEKCLGDAGLSGVTSQSDFHDFCHTLQSRGQLQLF